MPHVNPQNTTIMTVEVYGYEVSSDPGIQHITSYKGSIDVADIRPDMDIESVIEDSWWRGSISPKFKKLTFVELREYGALFKYGEREVTVPYGKTVQIDEVGLSYAYGELHVKVTKD